MEGTRRVPVEVEERVADPACHWHQVSHEHGVEVGKVHTHHE